MSGPGTFDLPTREYSGFIFDCDGTLADSMPLHHAAWREAFIAHAAPFDFDWPLFFRRAGKTLEVTIDELNAEFGAGLDAARVAARQRQAYAGLIPSVQPIGPVVDFLRSVAGRFPVSVASGGDYLTIKRTLELIGVLELVPVIVTAADVRFGKPAPDLFLLAAERMGVAPSECLVFEDSPLGIEAAERAGMGAVLVRSRAA